jgi:hypothetical protein
MGRFVLKFLYYSHCMRAFYLLGIRGLLVLFRMTCIHVRTVSTVAGLRNIKALLLLLLLLLLIALLQGIYSCKPEMNDVFRVYTVEAIV